MTRSKRRVFISFAHTDEDYAEVVVRALEHAGADRSGRVSKNSVQVEIREIDEDELSSVGGLNALFVDLFVGPNATFVCVAFNRYLQTYRVDIKETDLAAMVDDVRKRLEVGLRADTAAKALSDTLFRKARWPAPRAVLVAPDGPLWRIPMDVLPIPESGTRLGELAPVVTIPSASVLLDMHRLESTPAAMHFFGVVHAGTSSEIKLDRAAREVTAICEVLGDCSARTVLGGDSPLPATRENLIRYLLPPPMSILQRTRLPMMPVALNPIF